MTTPAIDLPDGDLVQSRVVADPRDPLAAALDRSLTGYATFEPQESLLLDGHGRGIVTLHDGVPRLAYYTGTDRGGPAALADLATPGPYRVELYELEAGVLDPLTDEADLQVPPGAPAERLAGDPALATSTRRAAPAAWSEAADTDASDAGTGTDETEDRRSAVEAFLDDAEKIEAIREQARQEAEARAEEWGFAESDA
jgi:hypothetical protein